jgi:hypothetical protein
VKKLRKKAGGRISPAARLNRFCVFQVRILPNPNLRGLQRLNVRGLQALGAADNFEFDRLAVVQGLVAISLDRGKMHEYIFPRLALDETKALAGVKPLHCSLFFAHFVVLFSLKKLSGAPLTETIGCKNVFLRSGFVSTNPETRGSGRLQLRFFVSDSAQSL